MKKIILIILIISFGYSGEYFYNDGKKVYVTLEKPNISRYHNNGVASNTKYYTTKSGITLGVNNDIIVNTTNPNNNHNLNNPNHNHNHNHKASKGTAALKDKTSKRQLILNH